MFVTHERVVAWKESNLVTNSIFPRCKFPPAANMNQGEQLSRLFAPATDVVSFFLFFGERGKSI